MQLCINSYLVTWYDYPMHTTNTLAELGLQLDTIYQADGQDPMLRALARKALLQTYVLSYSETDTAVAEPSPQNIGIFRVLPTLATIDYVSPSGDLRINAGQTYLDFHMPKSEGISNAAANDGYSLIADYMKQQPDIDFIMGVTYRVMALSAKRNQGFYTEQLVLPDVVQNYASAYWQGMMPDAKPKQFESAHVVWQPADEFIDRFGTTA